MKLTTEQYLLNCLAEECSEVIQRVTKSLRFGLDEVQEGQPLTNAERLAYEYNDILSVMEELLEVVDIPDVGSAEQIARKSSKIRKYLEYSRSIGIVED